LKPNERQLSANVEKPTYSRDTLKNLFNKIHDFDFD
jgi:hypothetical protein